MAGLRRGSDVDGGTSGMRRCEDGVALVLVLWVVTLLAVIGGNFAYSMRGEIMAARNLYASNQARALADAGVMRAWYELMKSPADPLRWQGDGAPHILELDGAKVLVRILDESGKIDLNTASEPLMKGLFKSAGLSEEGGGALLDAILDWRDADKLRRANGAEEEEYRAAGRNYGPTNVPFETVDELRRVLGMTREIFAKLAPALTVYSKQPGVNAAIAPREVLLALPGADPVMVEAFLTQRMAAFAAGQKAPPFPVANPYLSMSGGLAAYSVRSEVRMADGTVFVREAVARLTQEPKRPVRILAWNEGEAVLDLETIN